MTIENLRDSGPRGLHLGMEGQPAGGGRHIPVMLAECLAFLEVRSDGHYIDATLGGGGHAEAILRLLESGKLLGIDRDPSACQDARGRLSRFGEKLTVMEGNFADIDRLNAASGLPPADGM